MSGDTPSSPIDLTCEEKLAPIDLCAHSPPAPIPPTLDELPATQRIDTDSEDSRSSICSDDSYSPPSTPIPTTPSSEEKTPAPGS